MCGADPAALTCFLQCQVSLARFNGLSQFRLELFLQTLQMFPCQEENERLEAGRKGAVLQMRRHTLLNRTGQFLTNSLDQSKNFKAISRMDV